jgi:hypothetical protein
MRNDTGMVSSSSRASTLRRRWLERAFESAGIDSAHWDPERGVDVNRAAIERVYAYYGRLFIADARLEWAGMANLIGPSFYAGFQDVGLLPDLMRRLLTAVRRLLRAGRRAVARALRRRDLAEELVVGELGYFETTFLTMQRKIFEDQALMHEAYTRAGIGAIRELAAGGIVDSTTLRAWEQIDGGDAGSVHDGNRILLYREQHDIIDRFYVDMRRRRPPIGRFFTYLLTLIGSPAIPGARSYPTVFPFELRLPISRDRRLALRTPLAAGNLALFTNRWKLIEDDTFPTYRELLERHPADLRRLIERPLDERTARFRLLRRAGGIVLAAVTRWRLGVERVAAPAPAPDVDLRVPPGDVGTRVWADLRRRPFVFTVLLPEGRSFSSEVDVAAVYASQLSVKLPLTDLAGARAILTEYVREWQLDEATVAEWAERAAVVTTKSHAYSTRVFRAPPIGLVRLEVQVEHHVEQSGYVVDVLFSWPASTSGRRHAEA